MSLINEALKRTQQAEQAKPLPTSELELRPADTTSAPETSGGGARTFLVVLVLVVVVLNLTLWLLFKDQDSGKARARVETKETIHAAKRPVTGEAQAPAHPILLGEGDVTPTTTPAASTPAATTNGGSAVTNMEVAITETNRPSLRLQSVVAHPTRPSAMINGRVLFVGDKVDGYMVRKIGQNDATLVNGEDLVVITLP